MEAKCTKYTSQLMMSLLMLILPILSMKLFTTNKVLMSLLVLEYLSLMSFMTISIFYFHLFYTSPMLVVFLVCVVGEGVLGLSIFISIMNTMSSNNLSSLSQMWN